MMNKEDKTSHPWIRPLWVCAGALSLSIGFIGVFLPLLPTTPLVILAAFCFSKGSIRLHQWILAQKGLGPLIREWETHGVIPLKAKCLATFMILVMVGYALMFKIEGILIRGVVIFTILCTLVFIWTRPSVSQQFNRVKGADDDS
jgi:uncharacterized membrane protein YbaN (DUF454 family)